jgi:hypothetical protein
MTGGNRDSCKPYRHWLWDHPKAGDRFMQGWNLFDAIVLGVGGFMMWAARVEPKEVVSRWAQWAKAFGLRNPPEWLKSDNADRIIQRVGLILILAAVVSYGIRNGVFAGSYMPFWETYGWVGIAALAFGSWFVISVSRPFLPKIRAKIFALTHREAAETDQAAELKTSPQLPIGSIARRIDDHDLIPWHSKVLGTRTVDGADISVLVRVRNRSLIRLFAALEKEWSFAVDGREPHQRHIDVPREVNPSTELSILFPVTRILKATPGITGHVEMAIKFGASLNSLTDVLHLRYDFKFKGELKKEDKGRVEIECELIPTSRYSKASLAN